VFVPWPRVGVAIPGGRVCGVIGCAVCGLPTPVGLPAAGSGFPPPHDTLDTADWSLSGLVVALPPGVVGGLTPLCWEADTREGLLDPAPCSLQTSLKSHSLSVSPPNRSTASPNEAAWTSLLLEADSVKNSKNPRSNGVQTALNRR